MFYVIKLKKILLICTVLFISILVYFGNINENVYTTSNNVVSNIIVIDAGHGEPDGGAVSSTRNKRSKP